MMETLSSGNPVTKQSHLGHATLPSGPSLSPSSSSSSSSNCSVPFVADMMAPKVAVATANTSHTNTQTTSASCDSPSTVQRSTEVGISINNCDTSGKNDASLELTSQCINASISTLGNDGDCNNNQSDSTRLVTASPPTPQQRSELCNSPDKSDHDRSEGDTVLVIDETISDSESNTISGTEDRVMISRLSPSPTNDRESAAPTTSGSNTIQQPEGLVMVLASTQSPQKVQPLATTSSHTQPTLTTVAINLVSSNPKSSIVPTVTLDNSKVAVTSTSANITTISNSPLQTRAVIPALSVVAALKSSNNKTFTQAVSPNVVSTSSATVSSSSISPPLVVNGHDSSLAAVGAALAATATISASGTKSVVSTSSSTSASSQQAQKRPMNAFLIFCKRHRSVVREKYPHLENRSITKILGEWWAALDAEEKHNYTDLARQYKEAFMKANPHFKWYKTTDLRPPHSSSPSTTVASSSSSSVASTMVNSVSTGQLVSALPTATNVMVQLSLSSTSPKAAFSSSSAVPITTSSDTSGSISSSSSSAQTSVIGSITNGSNESSSISPSLSHSVIITGSVGSPAAEATTSNSFNGLVSSATTALSHSTTSTASTKLPPKKRYLESLESSKSANIASSSQTAATSQSSSISSVKAGTSAMSVNVNTTGNGSNKRVSGSISIGGPVLLDDETASRVIEAQLGLNTSKSDTSLHFGNTATNGQSAQTAPAPTLVGLPKPSFSFSESMTTSLFEEDRRPHQTAAASVPQSQLSSPGNGSIADLVHANSDMKAAKTMLVFAAAASAIGSNPNVATGMANSTGSVGSGSASGTGSGSGSDTASDEELELNEKSSISPAAARNNSHSSNIASMILQPRSSVMKAGQPLNKSHMQDDDEQPLNLSASSNKKRIEESSKIKSNTEDNGEGRVYSASNQQIIDVYIDKFLSTGTVCNSNGYAKAPPIHPPRLSLESRPDPRSASKTESNQINLSNSELNLSTTSGSNTNALIQSSASANPPANSRLVLIPKDYSLRSSSNSPSVVTTLAVHATQPSNLLVLNTATSANGGSTGLSNGNKRPLEPTGGYPLKVSPGLLVKPVECSTPNKRSRLNGTVIGVSEMIALANQQQPQQSATSLASATVTTSAALTTPSQSKFVTGSFDLEEHIRALPQLADTHLVNALHRTVEAQAKAAAASTSVVSTSPPVTGLMVLTTSTTANSDPLMPITMSSVNNTSGTTLNLDKAISTVQTSSTVTGASSPSGTTATVLLKSNSPPPCGINIPQLHLQTADIQTATSSGLETALPLRLVTTATATGAANATVNSGQQGRMQVSQGQVLIKLAPGQTLTGANVVMPVAIAGGSAGAAGRAAVQTADGTVLPLTPLIIRSPSGALTAAAVQNNNPVDLSMSTQSVTPTATTVSLGALQSLATIRTTLSSGVTMAQSPTATYISPSLTAAVAQHPPNSTPTSIITSSAALSQQPTSAVSIPPTASSDRMTTPGPHLHTSQSLLSTVISSQGSINQCDGLAALAEIALQQARAT